MHIQRYAQYVQHNFVYIILAVCSGGELYNWSIVHKAMDLSLSLNFGQGVKSRKNTSL